MRHRLARTAIHFEEVHLAVLQSVFEVNFDIGIDGQFHLIALQIFRLKTDCKWPGTQSSTVEEEDIAAIKYR
jgi:hypothetical protein